MNNKELCEKLYDVAIKELSDFEKSLDTVEKALGAAYELSVKRDIMSYIENEINEITSDDMEKAITEMINSGSPLSLIYDEWLGNEYDNRMEAIRMTADDVIDITAEKAANRDIHEKNVILQTKFPYENNIFPNDITYNEDSRSFSWVYFNEDGNGGDGEFIDITITDIDVLAAYNSDNFLEYIYQNCKQNVIDTHSEYFESYANAYINKSENVVRRYDELTIRAYLESNSPLVQKAKKSIEGEITVDSDELVIDGYESTWYVVDTENVDGKEIFLLENEEYGDETFGIIIDKDRNVLVDEAWNGFSDYHEKYDNITPEEKIANINNHLDKIISEATLLESNSPLVQKAKAFEGTIAADSDDILNNIHEGTYNFTVISFDGNNQIAIDEYVEKNDPSLYDLDLFKEYASTLDKDINDVEVEASFYTIGKGGAEADPPDEIQLAYINNHLDKIISEATLLESNTFTVDISDVERSAKEKIYAFTVVEFEDNSVYVLPGKVDDNNIKETDAWKEVKERCFDIDSTQDLDESIKVIYTFCNTENPNAVIPSENKASEIKINLEHYKENADVSGEESYVHPWINCEDIIYDMRKQWEIIHNSEPSVSDEFDKDNYLFPKEPKVYARLEGGKELYNIDEAIQQIKLFGKEWLNPSDAAYEMNRRGVDIADIEMLNVRYLTSKGEVGCKDMTPEMFAVYHTRTEQHTSEFKEAMNTFDAKYTEVYKKSAEEAHRAGEIDLYRQSNKVNHNCAKMIDAVNASHYENNRFHAKDALNEIMERGYSIERISLVVAVNIADKSWDARLSAQNISWAKDYLADFSDEIMERRKGEYYVTTHPGLLNMFVDEVREEIACRTEIKSENISYSDKLIEVEEVADKIQDAIDNGELDKSKEEQSRGQER